MLPSYSEAVCIAGGPSLTRVDCAYAEGRAPIIGVNDAYRIAALDILYASDYAWWHHHWAQVVKLDCMKFTCAQDDPDPPPVSVLPAEFGTDLRSNTLNLGGNSGFAALHLAILCGARRIYLLGYDMKGRSPAHWFGQHPTGLRKTGNYPAWAQYLNQAPKPAGVEIINCSRDTAINCFPQATIQEALCGPAYSKSE